ncbi:MAG: porin [Hyphomicrobium sp.]
MHSFAHLRAAVMGSTSAQAVSIRAVSLRSVAIALFALGAAPVPAMAADLGGNCCADLEERIAELEATTARKGNRKVSLTVAGQVNKAILFWDDGAESNAYVVGNKNDQTNISFTGDAKVAPGWAVGYDLTLRVRDTLSDDVNQDDDNGSGDPFQLWQSHIWVESENLGKVSLGRASRVSDTAPENDMSEAGVAGYAGVQDIGGAFAFRRADGVLLGLGWGDVYNHINGDTANLIRYDTPEIAGFIASASWGEDDIWDVGLRYEGEGGGFKLAASVAYTEITDTDGEFADVDQSTVIGSVAVLHEPSGLNALISAGSRQFDDSTIDADGALRTPEDARFIYGKIGWIAKLNALGPTAFYGEYGWFKDFVSVQDDAGLAADLRVGGAATRISGSTAEVWGAGVVQHIEAAEMQIYLGYRNHSADFDLVNGGGAAVAGQGIEDFHTVIAGSKIAF